MRAEVAATSVEADSHGPAVHVEHGQKSPTGSPLGKAQHFEELGLDPLGDHHVRHELVGGLQGLASGLDHDIVFCVEVCRDELVGIGGLLEGSHDPFYDLGVMTRHSWSLLPPQTRCQSCGEPYVSSGKSPTENAQRY
jgi:hypothetical protein